MAANPLVRLDSSAPSFQIVDEAPDPLVLQVAGGGGGTTFTTVSSTSEPVPAPYWWLIDRVVVQVDVLAAPAGVVMTRQHGVLFELYDTLRRADRLLDFTENGARDLAEYSPRPLFLRPGRQLVASWTFPQAGRSSLCTAAIHYRIVQR